MLLQSMSYFEYPFNDFEKNIQNAYNAFFPF